MSNGKNFVSGYVRRKKNGKRGCRLVNGYYRKKKSEHRIMIDISKVDDDNFVGVVKYDTLNFSIYATDFVQGITQAVEKIFKAKLTSYVQSDEKEKKE